MLRIDTPIKRDTFDVLKSDSFQKFSYRLLIISEMVFITLTEVIIDVLQCAPDPRFSLAGADQDMRLILRRPHRWWREMRNSERRWRKAESSPGESSRETNDFKRAFMVHGQALA